MPFVKPSEFAPRFEDCPVCMTPNKTTAILGAVDDLGQPVKAYTAWCPKCLQVRGT